ncbi:interleukin-4-like [Indicator indicator]|uniref:interleukin-4-like n=1 Tax=Indicator indicator TaxID=1002788 RepID=UPI0023DEA870|nr:interleukin-4-like [Indicator indicator]
MGMLLLLTTLLLSACQGHSATLLPPTSNFLRENIRLLSQLLQTQGSCDRRNVTDVFAGGKTGDDVEILCKAATVLGESQSCHSYLEGIYSNLLTLVQRKNMGHKAPCPVAGATTTSLKEFLMDLRRVHQRFMKNRSWE